MGILDPTPSAILLPLWTVLQKYTLFGLTLDEIIYIPRPTILTAREGGGGRIWISLHPLNPTTFSKSNAFKNVEKI